jgi:hypothetical protein
MLLISPLQQDLAHQTFRFLRSHLDPILEMLPSGRLIAFTELANELSGKFDLAIIPHPDRPEPALALAKSLGKQVCSSEGNELIDFPSDLPRAYRKR